MAGFFWYELMTTDVEGAKAFYSKVVGWAPRGFEGGGDYTLLGLGDGGEAGGMMASPPGMPSFWIGYIYTPDVDASVEKLKAAGGKVQREPWDIPGVGRLAAVSDPQGAGFMLMTPRGEGAPPPPRGAQGRVDWRELHSTDWEAGWDFYSGLYGWEKSQAMDMGEMGSYQLFSDASEDIGAMFNNPHLPMPAWLYYFRVPSIDRAIETVKDAGGQVIQGPHEVPGGDWIIQGMDPQGAMFALVGGK